MKRSILAHKLLRSHCFKKKDILLTELFVLRLDQHQRSISKEQTTSEYVYVKMQDKVDGKMPLFNTLICRACWAMANDIPMTKVESVGSQMRKGRNDFGHRRRDSVQTARPKTESVRAWLATYIQDFGDHMPHVDRTYLPPCELKELYHTMHFTLTNTKKGDEQKDAIISYSMFCRMIRENKAVSVKKHSAFVQCGTCAGYKSELESKIGRAYLQSKVLRIKSLQKLHRKQVNAERLEYAKNKMRGAVNPDEYLSVAIDGYDQRKSYLPMSQEQLKAVANLPRIKTRVVGGIVHGRMRFLFHMMDNIPGDSNLTVTILLKIIRALEDGAPKRLPRILLLQLDNCSCENKNKYVMSLLYWLVIAEVFDRIEVHFLPVGHTHNDCDRHFSYISTFPKIKKAYGHIKTADAYLEMAKTAIASRSFFKDQEEVFYNTPVVIDTITRTLGIKAWLEPHLEPNWTGITKPRCFIFAKGSKRRTCLWQYRMRMAAVEGDNLCPAQGLHPFTTLPQIDDLRYSTNYNVMPYIMYQETIRAYKKANIFVDEDVKKWDAIFTETKTLVCEVCDKMKALRAKYWEDTKPGAKGARRKDAEYKELKRLDDKLLKHEQKEHNAEIWKDVPTGLKGLKVRDPDQPMQLDEEDEDEGDKKDDNIILLPPENDVFRVGGSEKNIRFKDPIKRGDYVIVCLAEHESSVESPIKGVPWLAQVVDQVDGRDDAVLIHWWGNNNRKLTGAQYPGYIVKIRGKGSKESFAKRRPPKKQKPEPNTDVVDRDAIVFGPVVLTAGGLIPIGIMRYLSRRGDLDFTFDSR